ncbi:MAG: LptA/OstA family protein [Sphingomonadaceae bacterium]
MTAAGSAFARAAAAALLALIMVPGPAAGQLSSLRGHDTNAPVDFAADRIEVQDRADRAVLSGDVVVRQAGLTVRAGRLTLAYSDVGGIDVDRLDASGGVTVSSGGESARANMAIYDLNRKIITMVGDVALDAGGGEVRGGRLVIDLTSGRAVMEGGPSRAGGRVTGTFTVPQTAGR